MTERKPAGVRFESWVERQIREARDRGVFDDLPGAGQPLPTSASDDLAWIRAKVKKEGLPVSALLPPSLAVAKEVEELPTVLARLRSEDRVRAAVQAVNARIDAARRGPAAGPPVRTAFLDVEQVVTDWRAARPAPAPVVATAPRARWWRRRSRD